MDEVSVSSQTSISYLPRGCLVHILQFLQLSERLRDSAVVSKAWAEAAAAATTSISRSQVDAHCCSAVIRWASTCAQQMSSLQLMGAPASDPGVAAVLQPLPLPALQQLHLLKVSLQLAASAPSCVNPLLTLSALTELQLRSCTVLPDMRALSALSALAHLQRLTLSIPVPALQQSSTPAPEWSLPSSSTWSHLTALTHLDVAAQHNVTGPWLQELTVMTQLQELLLYAGHLTTPRLEHLQQLPCLHLLDLQLAPHISFSSSSTPVLMQMSQLRRLSLFCWQELQPALLASLSQLQHLQLRAWAKRSSPAELTAFLAALAQLTHLTTISLQEVLLLVDPEEQPLGSMQQGELAPAACAALTASSALHTLDLHHAELPPGAWALMFPADRQLPALRALVLSDVTQQMTDAEFEQLVCCCPGLTGLTLLRALQWGVSVEPLLQLPQLQEVELRHLHGDSAMRLYAQMTGLRRLHNDDANVSMAGLSRLTALKRLTHLHMHCSADPWSLPRPVSISNQAPEWLLPDVWSQLRRLVES